MKRGNQTDEETGCGGESSLDAAAIRNAVVLVADPDPRTSMRASRLFTMLDGRIDVPHLSSSSAARTR